MKDKNYIKISFFILLFILSISCIKAIDLSNLIAYYQADESSQNDNLIDTTGQYSMFLDGSQGGIYPISNYTYTTHKNSARWTEFSSRAGFYNLNFYNFSNQTDFSINFWVGGTIMQGNAHLFYISNSSVYNSSGDAGAINIAFSGWNNNTLFVGKHTWDYYTDNEHRAFLAYTPNETISTPAMITITWDRAIDLWRLYYNSSLVDEVDSSDFGAGVWTKDTSSIVILKSISQISIDEVSIWKSALGVLDIEEIYNNTDWYNQTLSNATYNSSYIYDVCLDSQTKCIKGYRDSANPSIFNCIEQQTCSLGQCQGYYSNNLIVLNGSAVCTINTINLYHICFSGNILCHNATSITGNINIDCPLTMDGGNSFNREYCPGNCRDNQTYWANIQASPINNDYGGQCGIINNECPAENVTRCFDSISVQQCKTNSINGGREWINYGVCMSGYTCISGACTYTGALSNVTAPGVNVADNFGSSFVIFPASRTLTANNRLLYVIMTLLISSFFVMGLFIGITYMGGMDVMAIGAFLTGIIDIAWLFFFISITYIPFWMVFIMVIITAGLIVIWIKGMFDSPVSEGGG